MLDCKSTTGELTRIFSDPCDRCLREFRGHVARALLAYVLCLAAFAVAVLTILAWSAETQMGRIHARRPVAGMHYEHVGWDAGGVVRNHPCGLMCSSGAAVPTESAISSAAYRSEPWPAFIRLAFIDLRPESCDGFLIHWINPPLGHGPGDDSRAGLFQSTPAGEA